MNGLMKIRNVWDASSSKRLSRAPSGSGFAPATRKVVQAVQNPIAKEPLDFFEVDEIAHGPDRAADFQEVAEGRAVGIAAGQGREVVGAETAAGLADGLEDDIGDGDGRARRGWGGGTAVSGGTAARELGLEAHSPDVGPGETEFDGLPEMVEVVARDRHRQRDGEIPFRAAIETGDPGLAKIGAAKRKLPAGLGAIELEIDLEAPCPGGPAQAIREFLFACDSNAVRVQKHVVDARMVLGPVEKFEEPRVERGFAPRKLENLDASLPIDDSLDAGLEVFEGRRLDSGSGADR